MQEDPPPYDENKWDVTILAGISVAVQFGKNYFQLYTTLVGHLQSRLCSVLHCLAKQHTVAAAQLAICSVQLTRGPV